MNLTKGTSAKELGYQLEDLSQPSSTFLAQPVKAKRVGLVLSDGRLSNIRVLKPSMSLRICVGFVVGVSEVGGGVDVGILFEEKITVARFYWLPNFKSPTTTCSISALNKPNMVRLSHDLHVTRD